MLNIDYSMDEINNLGFYLVIHDNDSLYFSDKSITDFLGIDIKFYHNILINEFNAYCENDKHLEIFFLNKSDVLNAKEWLQNNINSFLIIKKIEGKYK